MKIFNLVLVLSLMLIGCQEKAVLENQEPLLMDPEEKQQEELTAEITEELSFDIIYDEQSLPFKLFENKQFFSTSHNDIDKLMFKNNHRGIFYVTEDYNNETNRIITNTVLNYANNNGYYNLITTVGFTTDLMTQKSDNSFSNALLVVDKNELVVFLEFKEINAEQFLLLNDFFTEVLSLFSN